MEIIYKRFAELWNSQDEEFNNNLLSKLKDQIIFKPNDIKLYNTMPFYHNDILITLLEYATDKDYVKEFIYKYTCRLDLLDEDFLNKNIKSIVNIKINGYKDIYTYLDNNLDKFSSTSDIDFNFNNSHFIKEMRKHGINYYFDKKINYTNMKQLFNNTKFQENLDMYSLFVKEYDLICKIIRKKTMRITNFSKLYYSTYDYVEYITKEIFSETGKTVEINSNKILQSKYITKMVCFDKTYLHFERALGDLTKFKISSLNQKNIIIQLIEGLDYIHSHKLRHLDIKPGNFLYYYNNIVKYSDLDSCSFINKRNPQFSIMYAAPENFDNTGIKTYAYDIYSLGMVIYYLLNDNKHIFNMTEEQSKLLIPNYNKRDYTIIESYLISLPGGLEYYKNRKQNYYDNLIENKKYINLDTNNNLLTDLLKKMIHVDYHKRITLDEIKIHPYFEGYEFPKFEINEKILYIDNRKQNVFIRSIEYLKEFNNYNNNHIIFTCLQLLIRFLDYSYDIDDNIIKTCVYFSVIFNRDRKGKLPENILEFKKDIEYLIELLHKNFFKGIVRYPYYYDTLDNSTNYTPFMYEIINNIKKIEIPCESDIITFDDYQKLILVK